LLHYNGISVEVLDGGEAWSGSLLPRGLRHVHEIRLHRPHILAHEAVVVGPGSLCLAHVEIPILVKNAVLSGRGRALLRDLRLVL
jgi:hypothetical protein